MISRRTPSMNLLLSAFVGCLLIQWSTHHVFASERSNTDSCIPEDGQQCRKPISQQTNNNDPGTAAGVNVATLCRQFPTWSGHASPVDRTQCIEATSYDPHRDDLLPAGSLDEYFDHYGFDWVQTMALCLDEAIRTRRLENNKRNETEQSIPREPQMTGLYPTKENPILATVSFALSEEEAAVVLDLATCVRQYHFDNQFKHRSFGYSEDDDFVDANDEMEQHIEGGNDVTFINGFLQIFAPGIAAQVVRIGQMVWEAAEWGEVPEYQDIEEEFPFRDPPLSLGIRTSEHLSYDGWGELGAHADADSLYTILVSLSDPEDFEGGEFRLVPSDGSDNEILLKPDRLAATVFLSEEIHGVQPIRSGQREMFTTELWKFGDAPVGEQRPLPEVYEEYIRTGVWPMFLPDGDSEGEDYGDDME